MKGVGSTNSNSVLLCSDFRQLMRINVLAIMELQRKVAYLYVGYKNVEPTLTPLPMFVFSWQVSPVSLVVVSIQQLTLFMM